MNNYTVFINATFLNCFVAIFDSYILFLLCLGESYMPAKSTIVFSIQWVVCMHKAIGIVPWLFGMISCYDIDVWALTEGMLWLCIINDCQSMIVYFNSIWVCPHFKFLICSFDFNFYSFLEVIENANFWSVGCEFFKGEFCLWRVYFRVTIFHRRWLNQWGILRFCVRLIYASLTISS